MSPYLTAAAATTEASPGWGKLVALLVAALLFWAGSTAHTRWEESKKAPLSPTRDAGPMDGVKPQVTGHGDPIGDPLPAAPGRAVKDLDVYVAGRVDKARPAQIIREARRQFGKSEATVKRALRRVRERRQTGGGGPT